MADRNYNPLNSPYYRAATRGLTFGLSEPIGAAIASGMSYLAPQGNRPMSLREAYEAEIAKRESEQRANPTGYALSELAGGILPLATGLGAGSARMMGGSLPVLERMPREPSQVGLSLKELLETGAPRAQQSSGPGHTSESLAAWINGERERLLLKYREQNIPPDLVVEGLNKLKFMEESFKWPMREGNLPPHIAEKLQSQVANRMTEYNSIFAPQTPPPQWILDAMKTREIPEAITKINK